MQKTSIRTTLLCLRCCARVCQRVTACKSWSRTQKYASASGCQRCGARACLEAIKGNWVEVPSECDVLVAMSGLIFSVWACRDDPGRQ